MPHHNFPERFGFESDPRACVGKTIERIELLAMEFGCTWSHAFAIRFTDGSRAFFAGKPGTGIMNPQLDGKSYGDAHTVETSEIFTKPEYAAMVTAKEADAVRRRQDHERAERREFERLAAKFAGPTGR